MTALYAATLMGFIAAVGVIVDSAEALVARRAFADDGPYSYTVLRTGRRMLLAGAAARPLGVIFRYPAVLWLPSLQMMLGFLLLAAPLLPSRIQPAVIAVAGGGIFVARALFYTRQQFGLDGSDQMLLVVMFSVATAGIFSGSPVAEIGVYYAACQLLLSYFVAGVSKLIGQQWRNGTAMVGITSTVGYGNRLVHGLLSRNRVLALAACWTVIVFECVSPLFLLAGNTGALAFIVIGVIFHAGTAAIMGLNVFVWSFAACYPAILLLEHSLPHVFLS